MLDRSERLGAQFELVRIADRQMPPVGTEQADIFSQ